MTLSLPATIDQVDYLNWETYRPIYAELQTRPLSAETQRQWLEDWSYLTRFVREAFSYTYIQRTLDTSDPAREKAYLDMVSNLMPKGKIADQALKERLLQLDLDDEDMQIMLRNLRAEVDLFAEANLPLETELTKLTAEYDKQVGGFSAEWDGTTENLSQLAVHLSSNDRDERQRVWQTINTLWENARTDLNKIFDKMLALRQQVAENAGYANYRDYAFILRGRFAYDAEACFQFHDAISAAFVPAATRILERKRQALGFDTLKPWDYAPEMGKIIEGDSAEPLNPFSTEDELIHASLNIFNALDPDLGRYFATMADDGLLDLMTRQGKAAGGYCYGLPLRKKPFIFMNAVGSSRNMQTMFHEAGHAFHGFEAMASQPLIWMQRAPMEFNEVASMAMELLVAPYLTKEKGGLFTSAEAARHRIGHLEKIILFMPYMAVVDSFQHWLYTHIDAAKDAATRDAKWDELWQRFMPQIDWQGYEQIRSGGWHRKLHIFRYPFYYIEYGMAQIGALQLWRNSLDDHAQALADYRHALSL
ncbi:MAG TPA: M3 family oligoendopeptidase, partial [Anaerolineae bacterium]|nr:M3 family oligoendopeptidase [Anaerolineae bacterium]